MVYNGIQLHIFWLVPIKLLFLIVLDLISRVSHVKLKNKKVRVQRVWWIAAKLYPLSDRSRKMETPIIYYDRAEYIETVSTLFYQALARLPSDSLPRN